MSFVLRLHDNVFQHDDVLGRPGFLQGGATQQQALIPLYFQTNTWAMRKGLRYEPRRDEYTLAQGLRSTP